MHLDKVDLFDELLAIAYWLKHIKNNLRLTRVKHAYPGYSEQYTLVIDQLHSRVDTQNRHVFL